MNKIKNLEFLRIIFMFTVLWIHLARRIIDVMHNDTFTYFATHASNGGRAVEGFFIISGFLLVMTFKNSVSIIDFVKKKLIRLSPVMIFATIIAAIAGMFKLIHFSLPAGIMNVTMMLVMVGRTSLKHWNSLQVTWYVSAMFWVLLFYFSIMKTFEKKYANFLIGLCSIVAWFLVFHLNEGGLGWPSKTYYGILNVGVLRALGSIGIGCFIGDWYKNNIDRVRAEILSAKQKFVYSFCEFALLIICILELLILSERGCYNVTIVMYLAALIWLFVQQKGCVSQFFNKDWCVNLGKYSYSIYVLHILIYDILRKSGFIAFCGKLAIIPVFVIPILIGVLAYHLVEKPCADYLKKKMFNTAPKN